MGKLWEGRSKLNRRQARLEPTPRILIICEGEVTEPRYFKDFCHRERNELVTVEIGRGGAVPKTLVDRAVDSKKEARRLARQEHDSYLAYDEIWCVFDIDEHPNLNEARQKASVHGIRLAESNPCFELWALLHFQEQTAFIERNAVSSLLRSHVPKYVKQLPFDALHHRYFDSIQRAMALAKRCEQGLCSTGNPSTAVFLLTERIRLFGKEEQIKQRQGK